MNAYTDIQLIIVRHWQRDRLAEAEANRLTRRSPRPPAGYTRPRPTHDLGRQLLALLRLPAWR